MSNIMGARSAFPKPIAVPHPLDPLMHSRDSEFKALFGLPPKAKWPSEGTGTVKVKTSEGEELSLWVLPLSPRASQGVPRLVALCPRCSHTFGGGKIQQHYRICARR